MTTQNDLPRGDISTDAKELLETWERLSASHKMIGASCSCGAHGIVLRLEDFEQDIGDYLRTEAEQHQRRDVIALLERHARAADRWNIVSLIESMTKPAGSLDASAASFVLERLPRTVQSFEDLHRRR